MNSPEPNLDQLLTLVKGLVEKSERTSFTIKEVAARNAVSRVTVYRAIASGQLHAVRLGEGDRRGLRVTPVAEQDWLRNCACSDLPGVPA
jgi:excisionase family DNA binding protein